MPSDEALELLRQHYSETEAWKVAQIAATLIAGSAALKGPNTTEAYVSHARDLLTEARRQVEPEPVTTLGPRAFTQD